MAMIFCSFSPSALRMWERAACCKATDSNRSEMAWQRRWGMGAVVVVVVDVEAVVVDVVVKLVVELVLLVVVLEVVVVELVVLLVVVELLVLLVLEVGARQSGTSGSCPSNSSL